MIHHSHQRPSEVLVTENGSGIKPLEGSIKIKHQFSITTFYKTSKTYNKTITKEKTKNITI